jgi:FkbM family methyltransferase
MVFAKCFPGATVIAFEPDIENSRRLVKNVSLNGLTDRIVLCPFAIHCESGVLAWLSSGASSFSRTVKTPILHRNLNTSSYKQRIFTLSLDDAVFSLNLPRPSIIKIDAEGAEGPILRGGYRTLTEVKPVLLLEIHDEENGRTVDDVLRPLNREVFCVELGQATNGILQPFPAHYLVRLR